MGTIVNRNGRYRAVIRLKGETQTKTFAKAADAKAWMRDEENRLTHRVVDASGMTLGGILKRYCVDIIGQKTYEAAQYHHKRMAIQFSHTELADMNKDWWMAAAASWDVSPSSKLKYLVTLKSALLTAIDLWGVKYDFAPYHEAMGIMGRQKIVGQGRPRDQRVSPDVVAAIKGSAKWFSYAAPMPDIIDFALCTAMRRAEIMGLKWADLDAGKHPMIWVRNRKDPRKKDGNDDCVPLLGEALAIIKRQPRTPGEPRIFPFIPTTITVNFVHLVRFAKLKNIRFHDLRHEAITRLFEAGYSIQEVALVSGHKNWKTLQKYTHIKPESLHLGPLAHRRAA